MKWGLLLALALVGCHPIATGEFALEQDGSIRFEPREHAMVDAAAPPNRPMPPAPARKLRPESCSDEVVHLNERRACAAFGSTGEASHCPDGRRDLLHGCVADRACERADEVPGVVYVRAGSAGNGSFAAPFARIEDALAAAPQGGRVLVFPGTYSGTFVVDRNVTLEGACRQGVVLEPGRVLPPFDPNATGIQDRALVTIRWGSIASLTLRTREPGESRRHSGIFFVAGDGDVSDVVVDGFRSGIVSYAGEHDWKRIVVRHSLRHGMAVEGNSGVRGKTSKSAAEQDSACRLGTVHR